MKSLLHNYNHVAGKTCDWDITDSLEAWKKNMADPFCRQRLTELGYVDNPVQYKFNSHGFRTQELDLSFDAVCFGCSFTMGTGVHERDTWPAQLATMTGLKIANLGHAGSSNDTSFRFAYHYLNWLKPRYAIWVQTDRHRIEVLDDDNSLCFNILSSDQNSFFGNDRFIKTWFVNDSNQVMNLNKNTLAFQQLCDSLKIKAVILQRDQVPLHNTFPYADARDLTHPGSKEYKILAQNVANQLEKT
jgi:hypothetical protein